MEALLFFASLPGLLLVGAIGMFAHFLKKDIRGETATEIGNYFKDHLKSTFLALIVTVVSIIAYKVTIASNTPADILPCFLLGWSFDSTINKWDTAP